MSSSITTRDALVPGSVIHIDLGLPTEEWVRVTATSGEGPFVSEIRALGWWERWWLAVSGRVRRLQSLWLRRVWWPVVDSVADRWDERRRR